MASDVGTTAVIVAATRLHEALFYHPEALRELPERVRAAWGELQHALRTVNDHRPVNVTVGQLQDLDPELVGYAVGRQVASAMGV